MKNYVSILKINSVMATYTRILSEEGKKEIGHIFGSGIVPLTRYTPLWANLRGESCLVFLCNWDALGDNQKSAVIEYLANKFDADPNDIRTDIDASGHFPIRHQWIIESYNMRHFL